MAEWSDWADGNDLAQLSRGTSPLASMGYDADELRADPAKRAEAMDKVASPLDQRTPTRPGVTGRMELAQAARPATLSNGEPADPVLKTRQPPAAQIPVTTTAQAPPPQAQTIPDTLSGASAAPTPASPAASSPDWEGISKKAAEGALSLANESRNLYESAPDQPDTTALDTKIESETTPTNRLQKDPVTGKPMYEPTGMQRFGRGLKSAAIGLVTGGLPGALVGALEPGQIRGGTSYDAPNKAYQEDEAARQGNLAADTQSRTDILNRFKSLTDNINNRAKNLTTVEPGYKDAGSIATDAEKEGAAKLTAQTNADTRRDQSPQGQIDSMQRTEAEREREADRIFGPGKGGKMRTAFLAGWKPNELEKPDSGPGGDSGALPGSPTASGEDFLKGLPTDMQSTVRAIGEYREPPPAASNRSKEAQKLLNAVNRAYPGYRSDIWPTLVKSRAAFTSGRDGGTINSFNTALKHLDQMDKNVPSGTRFSTVNAVENALTPSGSDRGRTLGRFGVDSNAVSNEVQKAYKGGTVNKEEYETMQGLLNHNADPDTIKSNIQELRELLKGKLDSIRRQYESGLPPGSVIPLETIGEGGGASAATKGGGDNWFSQHPVAK